MRVRVSASSVLKVCFAWIGIGAVLYVLIYHDYIRLSPTPSEREEVHSASLTKNSIDLFVAPLYFNESSSDVRAPPRKVPLAANHSWAGVPIYMITPTYRRAEQVPELTRTAQTLLHVPNLVWIVVEDSAEPSREVLDYLAKSGMRHVYLRAQMPARFSKDRKKPRGVANRNAGIEWVRKNATAGVVYFGDDDNTYDLRIFEEIRSTRVVSMFPVGLVTKLGVSTPIVRSGRVIGFYDGWIANRKFPVDMAGFAINVKVFLDHPQAFMPFVVGYEEDGLLKNLKINVADIEPKAENCTKIWVWHTQTKKNVAVDDKALKPELQDTNLPVLRDKVWRGK